MIGSEMEVVVIDGQGGGIGRSVIEALKEAEAVLLLLR